MGQAATPCRFDDLCPLVLLTHLAGLLIETLTWLRSFRKLLWSVAFVSTLMAARPEGRS